MGAGGSSANKWPCAATSLLMAQPLYCHHPITNHHVSDSHRRLGPGRMTSEVETCHTDVPQTKTKQRLCCRIENWKLSSEGVIICKQRFNLSICSISELLESVTTTTAATLHWAALVSGTLETVSCWLAGISVKPGVWRLSRQLPSASPRNLGPCRTIAPSPYKWYNWFSGRKKPSRLGFLINNNKIGSKSPSSCQLQTQLVCASVRWQPRADITGSIEAIAIFFLIII